MKARQHIVRGGECGELIRNIDWAKTELGPLDDWSRELLSVVNTILNTPLAIVLITKNGGYLIYNDAYAKFAGPKHPEILGQNHAQAWPEIADYNNDLCNRIFNGEVVSYQEQLLQLKRGMEFENVYMDLNYSPIFSAAGDIIAMQVTVVDVTNAFNAKQLAADALTDMQLLKQRAENTALVNKAITENASTAFFMMDSDFKCTFMNPAAKAMTGYRFNEIRDSGKTLHEMIHYAYPDGRSYDSHECPINEAMMTQRPTSGDEIFIRKNGDYFPAYFAASPIIKDGELNQIVLEIRDMTDTEQLVELNRAKDDFIAMASHQLRTPATSVKQYLGILMNEYAGPVSEDQLQYLQIADSANERQLTIIDDLLKTALVDTKGFKLKLRMQNINSLLQASIKACRAVLDVKNQKLAADIPREAIMLRCDRTELGICIDNLIENASKYSGGGKTIEIALRKLTRAVDISVTDQGVGIAPADQELIFEKFTRVNNELSDTVSGNGLGLYWVKRIVDLHKGKIIIKSTIGKGTTFTIRLPL